MKKITKITVAESYKLLNLSYGNTKTGKGILIWNLLAIVTCIGSTAECRNKCYARKAERLYPNVLPSRTENKIEADSNEFVNNMIFTIQKASKRKGFTGLFRIHESGDFYNQQYLDAWKSIAKAFPDIKFLAFTKSWQLDLQANKPNNLNIVYSEFADTKVFKENMPLAIAKKGVQPSDLNKKRFLCPGSCATCSLCWTLKNDETVFFEMH